MRRHAFAKLTASHSFRAIASTLLVVMVVDVPARAFAQAAPPPAAGQSTAAKLANVPDSIPYEANPANVGPTRAMAVDIKNALLDAGLDIQTSGSYDELPTSDTVTFEDSYPDGDIIVTGKLVNGRIVLTKQFKPLLADGVSLGAPVTIPSNPPSATSNLSVTGAGAKPSPAAPAGAPPLPPEIIRKANLELEQQYKVEAATIEGPFVVTGPGDTLGTTKDVPVSLPVIIGLLIVRDLYYATLMAYARYLRQLKDLPFDQKKALVEKLIAAAPALNAAYTELNTEEGRKRWEGAEVTYSRIQHNLQLADRQGDLKRVEVLRKEADESRWGQFLKARDQFVNALGENKETQLLGLFRDTWSLNDEGFLFEYLAEPPASTEERVELFVEYLTLNIADLENEAADAKSVKTFSGLKQFLEPKYDRVREVAKMVTASTGVNLPGQSVDGLGDIYRSETSAHVAKQMAREVLIGVVLLLALTGLPVLGAVLNAGYAGYQVIKEGNELRIAWKRVDQVKRTGAVTGQEQVFSEEDRATAQRDKFIVTIPVAVTEAVTSADVGPALREGVSNIRRRISSGSTRTTSATKPSTAGATTPSAVDRAGTTMVDLPAARADAAAVARQRDQVASELAQVDRQLAAASPADRVKLQQQRDQLQSRVNQLDEEQRGLAELIARGEAAGVDRAAVTMADPNALREELADLNTRENAILSELTKIPSNTKSPALQQKKLALEKELDDIAKVKSEVSARVDRAESELSVEEALRRAEKINDEEIFPLQQQIKNLERRQERTPDKAQQAELGRRIEAIKRQLEPKLQAFDRMKKIAMRDLDAAEAAVAREGLDQEIERALQAGVPQTRLDELTKGYVRGQTDDLLQLSRMADDVIKERLVKKPMLEISNPKDQKAIREALDEASRIRGGVVTARETGSLPASLQRYLAQKGGLEYVDSLYDRYLLGGGPRGSLEERYPIVQNELLDELKTYIKPEASAARVPRAGETAAAAAGRPPTAASAPGTTNRSEVTDRQQEAATRALLGGTSLFGEQPGPPLAGPVGRTRAEEIAILEKQMVANAIRLSRLAPRAFGSGTDSTEAKAAQNEFLNIQMQQDAIIRERGLLQRDIGAGGGEGTKPSAPASPATGSPPKGTPPSTPTEGPGFSIRGEYKLKKADGSSPGTAIPSIIRIDGSNAYTFNPVALGHGSRLFVVQYIAAEGQEVTVPGASDPGKERQSVRTREWWHTGQLLRHLTALFVPPQLRASRRSEAAAGMSGGALARRTGGTSQPAAPSAPPVKIVLTSLGRSSGDAFEMTVLNEGPAPVTLRGDALVLEPVAEVTRAAVDKELAPLRSAGRAKTTLKAYCLEFLKQPPAVGMMFRLASEGVQGRFGSVGRIFQASRQLFDAGKLRPGAGDPSSPAGYLDDIRQWAIWTREQGFDEKGYLRAFTDHSRKNVEAGGHKWTRELDQAFTGLAAGRWQAVQMVLREASAR